MKNVIVFGTLALVLMGIYFWNPKATELPILPKTPKEAPSDWLYRQRSWPSGKISSSALERGIQQAKVLKQQKQKSKNAIAWEHVHESSVAGHVSDLAFSGDRLFAATPTGGLWISDDQGSNWRTTFDGMHSIGFGSIEVAPSQQDTIYAGTGSNDGGYASVYYPGAGLYKSTDRGESWQHLGLRDTLHIGQIAVHPSDPDLVYVAAMGSTVEENEHRGIYRSKDGGTTWEKVAFVNNRTGFSHIIIDPENPNRIFASSWERIRLKFSREYTGEGSGVWRSLDGGDNWEKLSNGLPASDSNLGRVGIAMAPSQTDTLYMIFSDATHNVGGVYKTTDGGESWTLLNYTNIRNIYGGFGWYFGELRVHPSNPDQVYALGVQMGISKDGGNSWPLYEDSLPIELQQDRSYSVHVDYHAMAFDPNDEGRVFIGNDGGIYVSNNDEFIFWPTATPPNAQLYTATISPDNPNILYGGYQDNGVQFTDSVSPGWFRIFGGDGMYVAISPDDPNSIFLEAQFGAIFHYHNGRYAAQDFPSTERFNWTAPIVFDPSDANRLYFGSHRVWQLKDWSFGSYPWTPISDDLTNGANGSGGTITTIAVAPSSSDVIYAGTDDGNVWVTQDEGSNWTKISENLPERWVTRLAVHPTDPQTAYVTFTGYYELDDQPYVLKTTDAGATWTSVTGNLPQAPLYDIIIDPSNPNRLFVAGEYGVYQTYNDGASWTQLGVGFPLVTVLDLDLHPDSGTLVAATFGRSIFKININEVTEDEPSTKTHAYVLSEVQYGDNANTFVSITNPSATALDVEITVFSALGQSLSVTNESISALGQHNFHVNEVFAGLDIGWIHVGSDTPVHVYAELQDEETRSAYHSSKPNSENTFVPHVAKDTDQFETVLSLVNPTVDNPNLSIHTTGQNLLLTSMMGGYSQESNDIRHYLGSDLGEVDFATLQSEDNVGFAAMEYFNTLPERNRSAALDLNAQKGNDLQFLHVATDNQLFWTGLVYFNAHDAQVNLTETFYDATGNVLDTNERSLAVAEKVTLLRDHNGSETIPEGTSHVFISGDGPLVGYELFGSVNSTGNSFFAGLQGNYTPQSQLDYPYLKVGDQDWTGFVVVNLAETATVTLTLYDGNGQELEQKTAEIAEFGKETIFANTYFTETALASGAWVRVSGEQTQWAGFQLWGDQNGSSRRYMSGIKAFSP